MPCILLRQIQNIKCQNKLGVDYEFIYGVFCDAKSRKDCFKQRNPLMVTPHCWRY